MTTVNSVLMRVAILLGVITTSQVSAQHVPVTVRTTTSSTTVLNARVFIDSSSGYIMGGEYQNFGGLWITDAIIPPDGVQLQKKLLPWKQLRQVEFLEWGNRSSKGRARARVVTTDGNSREVFLWNPARRDEWYELSPNAIKIVGELQLGATTQNVELKPLDTLRGLEFAHSQ